MRTSRTGIIVRYVAIVLGGLIMAIPLLFMVSGSLKSAAEVKAFPPVLVPETPIWQNFVDAWNFLTPQVIGNTFIFSLGVVGLQLLLSLPAAFALAKIPFKWSAAILATLVVPMMIPGNLTLIPLFVVTFELGWLNTYAGLIIPMAAQCAFSILLFRQFFATLPSGLIEAARIDGASWWRVLRSIALPLAKPALATFCSISFLTAWNMYIWPQVIAPNPANRVINVALAPLAGGENSVISPAIGLAGAVIAMLPVLIVFIVFQKWYLKGIAGTGLE
ncbi:carbohydrate ABC transporter permease [Paramicrobacterium chengjingii]|uniref:Carbohydrate ABC transporter permease n=1 Tax=Paramicrobacterium chengjingii TaxID=2769067 RepID=A0ABX6YJZ8_9MICO|nr:carbohydrate ABC transporter permease [Microbacterium chengjingii]QPZ38929.1 carbohydrate ABC transporter permease [Microbacterium chengjingii]